MMSSSGWLGERLQCDACARWLDGGDVCALVDHMAVDHLDHRPFVCAAPQCAAERFTLTTVVEHVAHKHDTCAEVSFSVDPTKEKSLRELLDMLRVNPPLPAVDCGDPQCGGADGGLLPLVAHVSGTHLNYAPLRCTLCRRSMPVAELPAHAADQHRNDRQINVLLTLDTGMEECLRNAMHLIVGQWLGRARAAGTQQPMGVVSVTSVASVRADDRANTLARVSGSPHLPPSQVPTGGDLHRDCQQVELMLRRKLDDALAQRDQALTKMQKMQEEFESLRRRRRSGWDVTETPKEKEETLALLAQLQAVYGEQTKELDAAKEALRQLAPNADGARNEAMIAELTQQRDEARAAAVSMRQYAHSLQQYCYQLCAQYNAAVPQHCIRSDYAFNWAAQPQAQWQAPPPAAAALQQRPKRPALMEPNQSAEDVTATEKKAKIDENTDANEADRPVADNDMSVEKGDDKGPEKTDNKPAVDVKQQTNETTASVPTKLQLPVTVNMAFMKSAGNYRCCVCRAWTNHGTERCLGCPVCRTPRHQPDTCRQLRYGGQRLINMQHALMTKWGRSAVEVTGAIMTHMCGLCRGTGHGWTDCPYRMQYESVLLDEDRCGRCDACAIDNIPPK